MTEIDEEQIEADRAAGTKGPFRVMQIFDSAFARTGVYKTPSLELVVECQAEFDQGRADARRFARLDALEAYALSTRRKLEAAEAMARALHFDQPRALARALAAWHAANEETDQ